MPSGLSTTRTPSISGPPPAGSRHSWLPGCDGGEQLLLEDVFQIGERPGGAAAGGVLVAAAAELLRDRVDVHVALRSHADAPVVVGGFLEEHRRLDLLHR